MPNIAQSNNNNDNNNNEMPAGKDVGKCQGHREKIPRVIEKRKD